MDDDPPLTFLDDDEPAGPDAADVAPAAETDLVIDDDDRYSRLRLIPWWRQDRLAAAKVLVVGAGALGNEVMKNLALLGVGTTYLIDLDDVEPSNLSRSVLFRQADGGRSKAEVAAERAVEINPDVRVVPIHGDVITDLGLGLFAAVDVVIGCLDNREARLWVNRQCWKVGTPWVDAGIQEIQGVVKVFAPPDSACYECAMTERDYQLLNLRYSCPLLRRDQILEGKVPTAPTIASMMAALEVQEALKILHGMPVAAGSAMVFNGVTNQFYTTKLPFREDCLSHETYPETTPLPLGNGDTGAALFAAAKAAGGMAGPLTLALDRDVVTRFECPRCGWSLDVFRPRTKVSVSESVCPACREPARPEVVNALEDDSPLSARPLADLGVPPYDVVRVDAADGSGFFLLSADADGLADGWAACATRPGVGPLSQDEIVFDDVKFREPERLTRPDRDRRWACLAYELPQPDDLPVFLDRATADAIERHALSDVSVELGGILLGKECVDDRTGEPFVFVTKSLEAKHYENTQASFTYTHESWEEITRERDRLHPELDVVGWYHTHPDFGVFLSSMDVFIHQHFFAQPLQVAYVVDPVRQTRSFFQWRDRRLAELGGFFLTSDRADRVALARAANDLENVPNPEGVGGGLSPRLEAELIAMLSRTSTPHYAPPSASERTLAAVIFTAVGMALGTVAVAAVLWLNQLNARVAEQVRATADLEKAVREASDRDRLALDAIGEVGGRSPEQFLDLYARAAKAREDARARLANQEAVNDALAARAKALRDEVAALGSRYESARKRADENEKDAKVVAEIRPAFAELKASHERQLTRIEELEQLTDTPDGRKAKDVISRYQRVWYAAAAGWTVTAALAAGIAWLLLLRTPPEDVGVGVDQAPNEPPPNPTTHRIT